MGKTLPLTQRDENQWHLLDGEQSLAHLASDADNGLSAAEAQQRLQEYGPNRLQEASRASLIHLFINQFRDLMIQVLLAAAVIAVSAAILLAGYPFGGCRSLHPACAGLPCVASALPVPGGPDRAWSENR
jgi:hypothetical protein